MNQIKSAIVLLLFCSYTIGMAQNTDQVKKRGPADSYARSSISYLLLDFENDIHHDYLTRAIRNTRVPSKFDNNRLPKQYIKAPYYHVPNSNNTNINSRKILKALTTDNYAVDIVKYWWRIGDDGSYSTDLIAKRGFYNATDEDVNRVDASKVGRARLADEGLNLMANSYVMVLDYHNMKTMKEIYDAQDKKAREKAKKDSTEFVPVKRTHNGFKAKMTAYLYQLNYSDTIQGYFDETFIDERKLDTEKLEKIFNNVYSPFKLVTTQTVDADGTQLNKGQPLSGPQKSKDQLAIKLVNDGISKSISQIEKRIEAFRVKAGITNLSPVRAKIGRKESLKHERRFFVWEYVENNRGNVVAKKKGVVRAGKVVNNRNDELGRTQESEFYQIAGGKLREGMTLQERKDMGIGIGGGFGSAGGFVRGDVNISQFADVPIKQFKLYAEFVFGSKEYTEINAIGTDQNTLDNLPSGEKIKEGKLAIGILKEYPFARNFHAGWLMGYTAETVSWENENDLLKDDRSGEELSHAGFNWGLRLGFNLVSYNIQVIGGISGYHYGTVTYKSGLEGVDDVELEQKMGDIFPDRSSISGEISIRINF